FQRRVRWWQSARDIRLILENHKMPYEDLRRVLHKKRNVPQEAQELTNATNEMSISQAMKMSCHQHGPKVTEQGSKTLNTQSHSHSQSNNDGHEKSCQTTAATATTTVNYDSHANGNNNYLLWQEDQHHCSDDSKNKLKMSHDVNTTATTTVTTTTTTTTIEKVNKSSIATIALGNKKNMPLESRYIFDCIAVV
ncbi:hypothetical protein DOY81_002488, partial [Sarcophaga bullata]